MRVLLLLAALCATGQALDNGAALTPPMGWNSWNHFGGGVSSQIMRDTASRLVDLGLAKVGYVHVNSDDCWLNRNRSADGSMVPTDKFGGSAGMLNLSNHLHSMGLKFGLYGAAGETTCASRAGGLYHEAADARQLAGWNVDYLKYDECGEVNIQSYAKFMAMRGAFFV